VNSLFNRPNQAQLNRLQKALTDCPETLLAYTDDTSELLHNLQRIALQTGLAIYSWSSARGLVSLKSRDVPVPGTRGLADALRYADRSNHYAIYVFTAQDKDDLIEMHAVLPRHRGWEMLSEKKKMMFVLPADQRLPYMESSDQVVQVDLSPPQTIRMGLRDGQWVPLDD
jgi:hypothetical protein